MTVNAALGKTCEAAWHGSLEQKALSLCFCPSSSLLLPSLLSYSAGPEVKRPMGVSENRGPYYNTLNSRILIIGTPE